MQIVCLSLDEENGQTPTNRFFTNGNLTVGQFNTENRDLLFFNYSILTTVYALQFTVGLVKMVLCKLFCKLQEYLIQVVPVPR